MLDLILFGSEAILDPILSNPMLPALDLALLDPVLPMPALTMSDPAFYLTQFCSLVWVK